MMNELCLLFNIPLTNNLTNQRLIACRLTASIFILFLMQAHACVSFSISCYDNHLSCHCLFDKNNFFQFGGDSALDLPIQLESRSYDDILLINSTCKGIITWKISESPRLFHSAPYLLQSILLISPKKDELDQHNSNSNLQLY